MAVFHLVSNGNQDTVEALQYLLHGALRGTVTCFQGAYQNKEGDELALMTGAYKAHPELAVMASVRMIQRLADDEDEDEND